MKIPNTTEEKPYIEFRVDKKGKIKLSASSSWWGGKNSSFYSSNGSEGNTCEPKNLEMYIRAFKERKIKALKQEISDLKKKLKTFKSQTDSWEL